MSSEQEKREGAHMTPSLRDQLGSASHELAIGLAPLIAVGAVVTIAVLALTNGESPALAAFSGSAAMFVGMHYWFDYLNRGT